MPVKPFIGILFTPARPLESVRSELTAAFGPLESQSPLYEFGFTSYYEREMGPNLQRMFCTLPGLVPADRLLDIRKRVRDMEDKLSVSGKRSVNLDPGYLDAFKVVLLSDKYSGRKVYLGEGCYADITMIFTNGVWRPVERAFPDFREGRYNNWFLEMRDGYLRELKRYQTQP